MCGAAAGKAYADSPPPIDAAPSLTIARYVLIEARRGALPWLALAACSRRARAWPRSCAGRDHREHARCRRRWSPPCCAPAPRSWSRPTSSRASCAKRTTKASSWRSRCRCRARRGTSASCSASRAPAPCLATLFALPLLLWAKAPDLAAWWLSLAAEAALVAAAALFFASALGQTVSRRCRRRPASTSSRARFPRSRRSPPARSPSDSRRRRQAARWLVDAFALLLPRLDAVTRRRLAALRRARARLSSRRRWRALRNLLRAARRGRAVRLPAGATCDALPRTSARSPRFPAGSCALLAAGLAAQVGWRTALHAGAPARVRSAARALAPRRCALASLGEPAALARLAML